VSRDCETDAFERRGFNNLPSGDRLLLWHGSRTGNYVSILKHGLNIAPPEAPIQGCMFGKGIYFADVRPIIMFHEAAGVG
jgi:poly [ADP-ribose] polymerase 2/3/4